MFSAFEKYTSVQVTIHTTPRCLSINNDFDATLICCKLLTLFDVDI